MRGEELLGLTWNDINFLKKEISITKTLVHIKDPETQTYCFKYQTPKTKNGTRIIPMQNSVYEALKQQHLHQKKLQMVSSDWTPAKGFENLVFVGKNGKPITEHQFQVALDGIEKSINQTRFIYSCLR